MSNIINLITQGKNTEAQEIINTVLYGKSQEKLEDLKKDIAGQIFKK